MTHLHDLPIDGVTSRIFSYLSYTNKIALLNTSRFFKKNDSLQNQLLSWRIQSSDNHLFFISKDGQVITLDRYDKFKPILSLNNHPSFVKIISGSKHHFLVDQNKNVYIFGLDCLGELGCGYPKRNQLDNVRDIVAPTMLDFILPNRKPIVEIVAGYYASFFRDNVGNWFACGRNKNGELGIYPFQDGAYRNDYSKIYKPVLIQAPCQHPIVKVVPDEHVTFFQMKNGEWFFCGIGFEKNSFISKSFLDEDINLWVPVRLPNNNPIINIIGNEGDFFLQDNQGNWYGCGLNEKGSLGFGHFDPVPFPEKILIGEKNKITKVIYKRSSSAFFCDNDNQWYQSGYPSFQQTDLSLQGYSLSTINAKPCPIFLPDNIQIIKIIPNKFQYFLLGSDNYWYVVGNIQNIPSLLNMTTKMKEIYIPQRLTFSALDRMKELKSVDEPTLKKLR